MSAAATSNSNNTSNSISEVDDVNMFQAARRNGRRNALGDLGEQLAQGEFSFLFLYLLNKYFLFYLVNTSTSSSEVDNMAPHFQSMSIKH
jgi:hypothetical protein